MSRRLHAAAAACCLAALLLPLTGRAAMAQEPAATSPVSVTGIPLAGPVQQSLQRLTELWLQWLGILSQGEGEQASVLVDEMLDIARQLGLERLPDLAHGAATRAVAAARRGESARAAWALEAAERLDPGRPEIAWAAAEVAWHSGSYLRFVTASLGGLWKLLLLPVERHLVLIDLGLWALGALLISGALFFVLQVATKGGGLFHDLVRLAARALPVPLARLVALALLLWPLAVPPPYGLLALFLYWSVLLWGYGSPSERAVMVALWVFLGLAPLAVMEARQRVALELSPPIKAAESLRQNRLYGALFTDLGLLSTLLPESPAVKHLLADFHRELGQWDLARLLYSEVLAEEDGEDATVLNNLGAYHFYKGEQATAVEYFRRATAADPGYVEAYYNLSKAYSEDYYFEESRAAMRRAREIDDQLVSRWDRNPDTRVLVADGGTTRVGEIRRQIAAGRSGEGGLSQVELLRRSLALLLALGLTLAALTLHLARRPFGYSEPPIDLRPRRSLPERLARSLLPGLGSAEVGDGGQAFAALLLPVALLLLPLGRHLFFRLPWGYDPGSRALWIVALIGLLATFVPRVVRELRREVR